MNKSDMIAEWEGRGHASAECPVYVSYEDEQVIYVPDDIEPMRWCDTHKLPMRERAKRCDAAPSGKMAAETNCQPIYVKPIPVPTAKETP